MIRAMIDAVRYWWIRRQLTRALDKMRRNFRAKMPDGWRDEVEP